MSFKINGVEINSDVNIVLDEEGTVGTSKIIRIPSSNNILITQPKIRTIVQNLTRNKVYQLLFTAGDERYIAYGKFSRTQWDMGRGLSVISGVSKLTPLVDREIARIDVSIECNYRVKARANKGFVEEYRGTVHNISTGGLLLGTQPYDVRPHSGIALSVELPNEARFAVIGKVVGIRRDKTVHYCGVQFTSIPEKSLEALNDFLDGQIKTE